MVQWLGHWPQAGVTEIQAAGCPPGYAMVLALLQLPCCEIGLRAWRTDASEVLGL